MIKSILYHVIQSNCKAHFQVIDCNLNKVVKPIQTCKAWMSLIIEKTCANMKLQVYFSPVSYSSSVAFLSVISVFRFSKFIAANQRGVSAPQKNEFQSENSNIKMKGCWRRTLELARICLLVFVCIFLSFGLQIFANCLIEQQ